MILFLTHIDAIISMIIDFMAPNQIGTFIRDRRKELNLTQEALASLAGCSKPFVIAAEAGKPSLRLDKLVSLLEVLGLQLQVADVDRRS